MPHYNENPNAGSNYFKATTLDSGPKKLRIMSPAFVFAECWSDDKTPVRAESIAELAGMRPAGGWRVQKGKEDSPHWVNAYIVWNHTEKALQVATFHQAGILKGFDQLENNEDWGDVREYDISLSRSKKSNGFFEYSVQGCPKKALPQEALEAWEKFENECVGLPALLSGGNPFQVFGN